MYAEVAGVPQEAGAADEQDKESLQVQEVAFSALLSEVIDKWWLNRRYEHWQLISAARLQSICSEAFCFEVNSEATKRLTEQCCARLANENWIKVDKSGAATYNRGTAQRKNRPSENERARQKVFWRE